MDFITTEQLVEYISADELNLTVRNDGVVAEISHEYSLFFDESVPSAQLKATGYQVKVTDANGKTLLSKKYKQPKTVVEKLLAYGLIDGDKVSVSLINDRFTSFEQMRKSREFDALDMQGLLDKYAYCDEFSLSYYAPSVALSPEQVDLAVTSAYERLVKDYDNLYEKYAQDLSVKADELFALLYDECVKYAEKVPSNEVFGRSFICDRVGEGTRFSEPRQFFWHAYHQIGCYLDFVAGVKMHQSEDKPNGYIFSVLNGEEYSAIKPHLTRHQIADHNHCTTTNAPIITLYFSLNEQTRAWLGRFNTDYDLEELDDLAFYACGEIQFSSCTHEGFHIDLSEKL